MVDEKGNLTKLAEPTLTFKVVNQPPQLDLVMVIQPNGFLGVNNHGKN